jgi:CRP-like cAMP-binding protein
MEESELRSVPLFESLSREERQVIAQHADEIEAPEGTELVRQGEFAYECFVIEEGTVARAGACS